MKTGRDRRYSALEPASSDHTSACRWTFSYRLFVNVGVEVSLRSHLFSLRSSPPACGQSVPPDSPMSEYCGEFDSSPDQTVFGSH